SLVFPGRASIILTLLVMLAYALIVMIRPTFDAADVVKYKEILVRLTSMAVATVIANMIVRIERTRRERAVEEALASHLEHQRIAEALRAQVEEFVAVTRIPVTVTEEGETPPIDARATGEIYRIVQEGLANLYRHADARTGRLTIAHDADSISICLADDGRGF